MRASLKTLVLLVVPSMLHAQAMPARPIEWAAMQGEATEVLRQYLRINTTNPPGNELETARFLKAFLEKEGIEAQILDTVELGKGRANLYARLKGNGSKKAIALVQHMDVVPAKQRDPGAFVTSSMMTGATDRPSYRKLGIIAYGLDPFKVEAADEQKGVLGNDERLAVANVGVGVKFVYDILRYAQ